MKPKLAIFDVDFTIKEHGAGTAKDFLLSANGFAKLFPDGKIPEEFITLFKEKGLNAYGEAVEAAVNKLGKTKNEIVDAMTNDGHLIKGMDKLFESLSKDHDIIIITGNYDEMVKGFLSRYGMLKYVTDIFAQPAIVTDDGKFNVCSIPKKWGGPCKAITAGRQICKVAVLKHYLQSHQYEKIVFAGDGSNDICLSLFLGSEDVIFPRVGYKLVELLEQHCVQAKVIAWKDGFDIMKHI